MDAEVKIEFCRVCEEVTVHLVRLETFWDTETGQIKMGMMAECRSCRVKFRRGKPVVWL